MKIQTTLVPANIEEVEATIAPLRWQYVAMMAMATLYAVLAFVVSNT